MSRPLLQITTTPAQFEYEVKYARLQITQEQPTVNRTVKRASLNMQRQAGRFDMNSVRRRSDMGLKEPLEQAQSQAQKGREQVLETTSNYVEFGNQVAMQHKGANIPDTLWSQRMQKNQGDLVLVPLSPVEIQYTPSVMEMEYKPSEISAEWNIGRAKLDFTPPSFEVNFTQYASINIEYVGGFNYAPPSANPNFEASA